MASEHPASDLQRTDPAGFRRLEALFDAVVDLEGGARAEAIAAAARHHPDLATGLAALVAAHDRLALADSAAPAEPSGVSVGSRVGAYRVVERLGEGGMGEVFRAERADGAFAADVAVKVTRATLAHRDLARRFQTERQILASLNHPNVVRLLDGGATEAGQAYLIMEHVAGVPVTEYCRTRRLPLAARLAIVRSICDGVQYAHQHGIVHRDLKPANVLVGADGVPKIVDFGIAKLLDAASADGQTTGALPGPLTPNYASPEQLRGLTVTSASDLYALGVLLYELVSGVRPYETHGQPFDRVLEIVMHTDPPRPSAAGAEARDDAGLPYRRTELRGDIDAIVRKAMHSDPAQRYASASELALDLERSLNGHPVLARAPSAGYVLRRLAARHKGTVSVAVLAIVAVVATLSVAIWQRQVARREQARAEARLRDVRQLASALIFKINDAVSGLQGSTPVRRIIVDEAIGYLEKLESESGDDEPFRLELASAYQRLGSILGDPTGPNLGERAEAIRLYERSRALLLPIVDHEAHHDLFASLATSNNALAALYNQQGDQPRAIDLGRESVDRAALFEATHPGDARGPQLAARAGFLLASMLPVTDSVPVWEETLARYEWLLADKPDDPGRQRNVALVAKYLGDVLAVTGDRTRAISLFSRALELDDRRLAAAPDDPRVQFDVAMSLGGTASAFATAGDADTAGRLYDRSLALRRTLAARDPRNMQARHRLGFLLTRTAMFHRTSNPAVARAHALEAIDVLGQVFDATGDRQARWDLAFAWRRLAEIEADVRNTRAECAALREAARRYTDSDEELTTGGQIRNAAETRQRLTACGRPTGNQAPLPTAH